MTDIQITVTIENLAPEGGTFLTPFWVGFHDGGFDLYNYDEPISPSFEKLVEDGDASAISADFMISEEGVVDGIISGQSGIEGVIDPGEIVTTTFTLDSEAPTSQFLSYASMIIPSNDAFFANGDQAGFRIFDQQGNFIGTDFIVPGNAAFDGGTEVNNEFAASTAFFSQTIPNTGTEENGVVSYHPGFIRDGRILTEDSTSEDAPAAFNNADFTDDNYQLARISVSIGDRNVQSPLILGSKITITSTLDGEEEVGEGDTNATGTSILTLNESGESLRYSLTIFDLDFTANGLIEGEAQTEDTGDDVTRLHIRNAAIGAEGDVVFSLFDTVTPQSGNILDIPGNQDEDLVVTANEDGSVTLTGVWEESDPTNIALREFVEEIREGAEDENLNLYWNASTNDFPEGAIRGQLVINNEEDSPEPEPEEEQTIELFRFRNTTFETGTYVFVGAEERDAILADPDLNQTFALDGEQEDGSFAPAFTASITPGDDLIPFFRLESLAVEGTFLFVSTEEYEAIFAEDSEQQDQWLRQGLDESGEDIPEFYLLDGSADSGTEFNRFQNNQNNTFLYAGPEESSAIADDPNLSSLFTNQGVAFESLV